MIETFLQAVAAVFGVVCGVIAVIWTINFLDSLFDRVKKWAS